MKSGLVFVSSAVRSRAATAKSAALSTFGNLLFIAPKQENESRVWKPRASSKAKAVCRTESIYNIACESTSIYMRSWL